MGAALSGDQLEDRFGRAGLVRFETSQNGLVRAIVTAPQAEAHIYLQGAHVTHYQRRGEPPVLFLSARSVFAPGRAIRGGVPIVFPWFGPLGGDPAAPMHGFARVAAWEVEFVEPVSDGSVAIGLRLDAFETMQASWPHHFVARYRVGVGSTLDVQLEVQNVSAEPFAFEQALHTYLAVGDVRGVSLSGLGGTAYLDKTDAMRRKLQGPEAIRITGETDRVYLGTRAACMLDDPTGGRRLIVEKEGSEVTVVWNPWAEKTRLMADLADDEWLRFLCIETANAADRTVTLPPGMRHQMRAAIRAEPR